MRFAFISLFILIIAGTMSAQKFATLIDSDNFAWLRDFEIVTTDGEELKAEKLSAYSVGNGRLKSFSFKTEDGVKYN